MNAEQARNISKVSTEVTTDLGLKHAHSLIEAAAKRGESRVYLYHHLTVQAKAKLEADGFDLSEHNDQREGYSCLISW